MRSVPEIVFLNINNQCNLTCKHCYFRSSIEGSKGMCAEVYCRICDQLAIAGVRKIRINGGEPWLHPEITRYLSYARSIGLQVTVVTNGYSLSFSEIDWCAANRVDLYFSLDGGTANEHDYFRNKEGSWKRAVGGIKHATNSGIDVRCFCVIARHNADGIKKLIHLLSDLNVSSAAFFYFSPFGRASDNAEIALSFLEWKNIVADLPDMIRDVNGNTRYFFEPTYQQLSDKPIECSLYKGSVCSIDWNGEVFFCSTLIDMHSKGYGNYSLGNVLNDDFLNIWQNSPRWSELKNHHQKYKSCKDTCPSYLWSKKSSNNPQPSCFMHWQEIK